VFLTSPVIDGDCYVVYFENKLGELFHFFWYFITFYVIILSIFIFCYWRILQVVRRQATVMSGHAAAESNPSQNPLDQKIQTSIIKTMILISGFYAVMWLPNNILFSIMTLSSDPNKYLTGGLYHVTLFLEFLYICTNPFIYAIKCYPVKEILLRMIPCINPVSSVPAPDLTWWFFVVARVVARVSEIPIRHDHGLGRSTVGLGWVQKF